MTSKALRPTSPRSGALGWSAELKTPSCGCLHMIRRTAMSWALLLLLLLLPPTPTGSQAAVLLCEVYSSPGRAGGLDAHQDTEAYLFECVDGAFLSEMRVWGWEDKCVGAVQWRCTNGEESLVYPRDQPGDANLTASFSLGIVALQGTSRAKSGPGPLQELFIGGYDLSDGGSSNSTSWFGPFGHCRNKSVETFYTTGTSCGDDGALATGAEIVFADGFAGGGVFATAMRLQCAKITPTCLAPHSGTSSVGKLPYRRHSSGVTAEHSRKHYAPHPLLCPMSKWYLPEIRSEGGGAASEASAPLVQGAGIALSSSSSHLTRRLEELDTSGTPSPTSSPTPSPTLSPTPAPECINHNVCGTPEYWERQDRIVYSSLISVACVLCACFSACGYMDWRNTRVESRNVIGPDNLTDFAHVRRAWREGGNGWTRTDRVGYSSGNGWTTDPAGFPGHAPAPEQEQQQRPTTSQSRTPTSPQPQSPRPAAPTTPVATMTGGGPTAYIVARVVDSQFTAQLPRAYGFAVSEDEQQIGPVHVV